MKICVLNYEFPPLGGGGGIGCYELSKELVKMGNEVIVITTGYNNLPSFEIKDGITIYRVNCFRRDIEVASFHSMSLFLPRTIHLLVNLIKKHDIEIINAHFALPSAIPGILVKKITKVPIVVTLIGGDIYDPTKRKHLFRRFGFNPICRFVLKHADSLTSISEDIRNRSIALGAKKDITVIPYGVNTELFNRKKRRNSIRKKIAGKNSRIILSVGRLIKRKGYGYLLRAIPEILIDFPESVFVIVGKGPEKRYLTKLVDKLGINDNVLFLGTIPNKNLPEIYANSDLFVLPSIHEGLGIVYLEAMASGLPIVTTNSGGMRDLIIDGQTGILIKPKNSEGIAKAIKDLLCDEELIKHLVNNGRELVERNFSWRQTAVKYLRAYQSICRSNSSTQNFSVL